MCNCYEKLILPLIGQFGHCTTLRHLLLIKKMLSQAYLVYLYLVNQVTGKLHFC